MARRQYEWVRVRKLTADEKLDIARQCEELIAGFLKPTYLPEIRPNEFNYPVDLFGAWRGSKYSFIVRFRSGFPENRGEEFNAAFARLDHDERSYDELRFDVMWHRHTGQWWRLHKSVPLSEALDLVRAGGPLIPPI